MTDIEKARREFLDECDAVVRSPGVCHTKGNHFSYHVNSLSVPLYLYMGLKRDCQNPNIEMKIFDGSVDYTKIQPNNIRDFFSIVSETGEDKIEYRDFLHNDFLNLQFYKNSKHIEKEASPKLPWTELMFLDELKIKCRKLGKYKLKIWSEIPFRELDWWIALHVAFCSLIFYIGGNFIPSRFNILKDKYKQKIIDAEYEYIALSRINNDLQKRKGDQHIINKIFAASLSMNYYTMNWPILISILGNLKIGKTLTDYRGISYKVARPQGFEDSDSLSRFWITRTHTPDNKAALTSEYLTYLVDILYKEKLKVAMSYETWSHQSEMLIFKWNRKEIGLFGPILDPLFFEGLPHEFDILWPLEKPGFMNNKIPKGISHNYGLVKIWGPYYEIDRVKAELERKRLESKILYDSSVMGWDYEGTKILEPEEYKLTKEQKIIKTDLPPEISESKIKIYIENGNPGVEIDGKFVNLQESSFACFALCGVSKYKKEDSLTFKELLLSAGRQELTKLNEDLKDFKIRLGTKRGKIYFMDEKKREISLDKNSLCTFESEHLGWLVKNMNSFFKEMEHLKIIDFSKKQKQIKIILYRYSLLASEGKKLIRCGYIVNSKLFAAIRNTELIKSAVEKLGWKFHDEKWNQNWTLIKGKVSEMLKIIGCGFEELFN